MLTALKQIKTNLLFSSFLIISLTSALFYTGNNIWLFTVSYLFIIANLALVLHQRFHRAIDVPLNGIFISAILLLAWFAIAVFPSQIKYLTLYNFFWVGSLVIVFLIFSLNEKKEQVWTFIWPGILLLVTIWAIYGLVQYYYLHVPTNATFLNRNSLAALINLALLPASGYFLLNEKNRPWNILNNKILATTLIILFLSIFIITSRGASLSLALGFIILLLLLRKHVDKSQLNSFFIIVFIAFLLATLSQYFIPNLPQGFAERMMSLKDTSEAGNPRFIIWNSLIPLFKEMPWYGFGLGSLWVFWPPHRPAIDTSAGFFAHNDYMQITLEAGYPGIILLISLLILILLSFIRTLKNSANNKELSLLHRVEIVSIFSALTTFAAHSFFTYNFYILPLLLISGLYLTRFNQLINTSSSSLKSIPALKFYFKPFMFYLSFAGIILILCSYFLAISLSSYYNNEAKFLMQQHKYQASNALFLKAQTLAPLMDNPFFSHADLLRRGADKLLRVEKFKQANSLIELAHINLDKAEKLNPLRPQTHHIRGLIYQQTQPEKAKLEFKKSLKLDPRFLFSRIRLARLLHKENKLNEAVEVLYQGVDYNYPVNKIMLTYMQYFAKLSREAGIESFALHLEKNVKKFKNAYQIKNQEKFKVEKFFIARQPLINRNNDVVGYELLYRDPFNNKNIKPDNDSSISIIINSFLNIGLDKLVGSAYAYIKIPKDFLFNEDLISMFKEQTVLELSCEDLLSDNAEDAFKRLKEYGYLVAIDHYDMNKVEEKYIYLADIIKIDVKNYLKEDIQIQLNTLKGFKGKITAYNVNTTEQFTYCNQLAFDYFQGFYFFQPLLIENHVITENSLVVIKIFEKLLDPDFNFDELGNVLAQDATLTYKLLRYVNSATFSNRKEINSIPAALKLIGADNIKKWVTLILLTRLAEGKPHSVLILALIRAKMSESIAIKEGLKGSEMFAVGLLSLIDTLMNTPMIEILDEITLSSELKIALLDHEGKYGKILENILLYEHCKWDELLNNNINKELYITAYTDAVHWSDSVTEALL